MTSYNALSVPFRRSWHCTGRYYYIARLPEIGAELHVEPTSHSWIATVRVDGHINPIRAEWQFQRLKTAQWALREYAHYYLER